MGEINRSEIKLFEYFKKVNELKSLDAIGDYTEKDFKDLQAIFIKHMGKPSEAVYLDDYAIARDGYKIPIRIYNYQNHKETPAFVYFPGGGYVIDLFEPNCVACSRIANYTKNDVKVIVINYRLAPEYSLPTSIEDAYDSVLYLNKNTKRFSINPNKILIGGMSSGANCASIIANQLQRNTHYHIYHQILFNGYYDLLESNNDYLDFEQSDKICTRSAIHALIRYSGLEKKEYRNPQYSPYYEYSLSGLPSTTIVVSEYDGLRSDSEAYYRKLRESNIGINKVVLKGQTHNTMLLWKAMIDGIDPAKIIATIILNQLIENSTS